MRPKRSLRERLFGPSASSLIEAAVDEAERRLWLSSMRY